MMAAPRKHASAAARQAAYRQRCAAQIQAQLDSGRAAAIPSMPGQRRWDAMRKQALCLLEHVASEMATHHEQRSERWQDSEKGEAFIEMMESIAEVADALRELQSP